MCTFNCFQFKTLDEYKRKFRSFVIAELFICITVQINVNLDAIVKQLYRGYSTQRIQRI